MQKIYNYFLANYFDKDYIEFSQAKLTLNVLLVSAIVAFNFAFIAYQINFKASIFVTPVMGVSYIGLALILKTKVRPDVIAFLYLLIGYFGLMLLIRYSGMLYSNSTPWFVFLPMAANLLLGRKASYVWLAIITLTIITLAFLTEHVPGIDEQYDKEYSQMFYTASYVGLTAGVLVLSLIFQSAMNNYILLLKEKNELITDINKELKQKNEEIISQNEALQQQKEEIAAQRKFIEIKNRELLDVQEELNNIIDKLTLTQTELASREAENRSILQAIYGTKLLVAEINREGRIVKVSKEVLEFFDKKEEEIIGMAFMDMAKSVRLEMQNALDVEKLWEGVLKGEHFNHMAMLEPKGKKAWIRQNLFPIMNESGEVEKIMVISLNISETVEQQEKIASLNKELKSNLGKIKSQNELLSTQREEIEAINQELEKSHKEVLRINQTLEQRVYERTKYLELQNQQLSEYAYINAHLLRGPLCSILGLVYLLDHECPDDHRDLIVHMKKATDELNTVVSKISDAIHKGTHFDRDELLS